MYVEFATAVKEVVDNYTLLKRIRSKGKADDSLLIKNILKKDD
jgi:hypothetical protein